MISMESFYSSLSAPQKIGPVGTQRYEQEEHLPEKEDKGQDSAIVGHASPQEVDIPTSEFFRPLQVKGIELKRLHL